MYHLDERINLKYDHLMDYYLNLFKKKLFFFSERGKIKNESFLPRSSILSLPNSYGKFFRKFDSR